MVTNRSDKFIKDHGCTTWGDYNNPPLPYEKCDISKFWSSFSTYGFREDIEFRQVRLQGQSYNTNVYVIVYHNVIFMINVGQEHENEKYVSIPHCYVVGCDHVWKTDLNIRGIGSITCQKCGYSEGYDCSD